jgi:hypothetical protein
MTDIHDSIPMPNRAERNAYPFGKLVEAGQCFVVECDDIKHERSVRSSATRWNSRHPDRRYVVRRLGKELLDEMIKNMGYLRHLSGQFKTTHTPRMAQISLLQS